MERQRQRRPPRRGVIQQAIVTPDSVHSHSSHSSSTAAHTGHANTITSITPTATTKACVECMRRKIRCNGRLPCDKCIYYEVPICQYRPRKQRKPKAQAAALNALAALSSPTAATATATAGADAGTGQQTATAAEALVARLFPGQDLAALMCLPRHTLLGLAKEGEGEAEDDNENENENDNDHDKDGHEKEDDSEGGRGWHEFRLHGHHDQQHDDVNDQEVCDDVNGLSINIHRRSYQGISSMQAIFRAMFRVKPELQWELQRAISQRGRARAPVAPAVTAATPAAPSVSAPSASSTSPSVSASASASAPLEEETAINAYFAHVHGIVPLLDEAHFRDLWRRGQRCDRPWLALLNMVLVMGSLAFGDERSSHVYYQRAQTYLDFELLATGCLESLQALCLLGGLFLHLKNAPNMAYTVMGMAYRIAIGLGLHRGGGESISSGQEGGPWRPQIRQRIWWSLFCLDTWGAMNLGRPTLGRWDPRTMTVRRLYATVDGDPLALCLDSATAFCLVATKIQQRLAQPSPMRTDEVLLFDAQVQSWHRSLPSVLIHSEQDHYQSQCPPQLRAAQRILRFRYFHLRLLLLRSVLIRWAHQRAPRSEKETDTPSALDEQAVSLCRDIACEAVEHIQLSSSTDHEVSPNRTLVWSAVWYLYQATMVLLLSIMVDPDHPQSPRWRASVETALVLLKSAAPVSRAAERSRLLVQSLLQICGGENNTSVNTAAVGPTDTGIDHNVHVNAGIAPPAFTFPAPAYPAMSLSPNGTTAIPNLINGANGTSGMPGVHGVDSLPMPEMMSDEDLWGLLGLDMFTEEAPASTWGINNELGDWPMAEYNGQGHNFGM